MQKRKNKKRAAAIGLCALLLSGCQKQNASVVWEEAVALQTQTQSMQETETKQKETQTESECGTIVVDISGAVVRPGVYELPKDSRIYDAIMAAGGLLAEADLDSLNQAQRLQDAAKITVLTETEAETAPDTTVSDSDIDAQASAKININTADVTQLCTLSGIGESRAKDIIAYREQNGPFQAIEEIMKVNGIKEATFNKIKEEIAVG